MLITKEDKKTYLNLIKSKEDKKLNHIFVFLEVFSREGGIQSYVKDVFQAYNTLSEPLRGEVFLLRDEKGCNNPFESERLKFRYFKAKSPQVGRAKMTLALLKRLIHERPDRVFCGHAYLAPLVGTLCQPLGIPYTVITHGKEVWQPLPKLTQTSLQKASQIWTVSRYTREISSNANSLNTNKIKILPCAVNGDRFTPGEKPADLLEHYGLVNAKVMMSVTRLWSGDIYKGVDVTIRGLSQIAEVFPEVKYLVIGRGDDKPRLMQLAKDLGVEDKVVFAGFVATEELVRHYRLADAYIMPSQEGFGIVYLEAMACGVPVLSGDADGSADPLQDGKLGWRVPHRDVNAVAAACIEILKGEDQRCNGEWLRKEVLSEFGIEAFQKRLQQQFLSSIKTN
ncbi:MAG: glycosyltransferase [Rivularia sp. ALOHA_DT_140]|nr:glycosyltransferase [Rivularia sp. ALOHA_DT_140]